MNDINVVLADCPGLGRVQLCECKSIHLSIGPITVSLAPEAFAQTAVLVRTAMEKLAEILDAKESACNPLQSFEPRQSRFTH